MNGTKREEGETMHIVIHPDNQQTHSPADTSAAQARTLLWACAGLLETLCLLGGMFWIMSADDPRPLTLRVSLVAALAVVCGV